MAIDGAEQRAVLVEEGVFYFCKLWSEEYRAHQLPQENTGISYHLHW